MNEYQKRGLFRLALLVGMLTVAVGFLDRVVLRKKRGGTAHES